MSKNMTRKGLAVGTVAALAIAGFITTPANAAGVDDTSSLAPTSGYSEGYAVPASATQTFSLTYVTNEATGGTIKFRVTDTAGKIEPSYASFAAAVGRGGPAVDQTSGITYKWTNATDRLEIITDGSALAVGDVIIFSHNLAKTTGGAVTYLAANTRAEVTAVNGTTSFTVQAPALDSADVTNAAAFEGTDATSKVVREARAADNSYVIDSGLVTSSTAADRTRTVRFINVDGASFTRSATVQGWVDNANLLNDRVDSIESLSPAREITFIKPADIAFVTSLTAPQVGDTTLAATVTTTPVLNGAQINDANTDFVRVIFTRQDSAVKVISAAATQSTVTGAWSTSVALADASSLQLWVDKDTTLTTAGTGDWGFTRPTQRLGNSNIESISVATTGVVTVKTDAAHNLRSGDKITMVVAAAEVDGIEVAGESAAAGRTVTVTAADTFTYTISETTLPTSAASQTSTSLAFDNTTGYTVVTYTSNNSVIDRVFAGDHSAQAAWNSLDDATAGSQKYTAAGTASVLGTSTPLAADVKFTTSGTASVQGSAVTSDDSTTDSLLKAGTLTADVVATVLDEDGDAVGAGRAVAWSFTGSASSIKVNGRTSGTTTLTDANGQVKFTVTDTLGLNGSTVKITATAEGVSTSVSSFTFEWATQAYSLYDLNVSDSAALATGTRRIAVGGSYDLALFVADQWYQAAADADYRVKVQGAGVTEGFLSLSGGKATVKVTDNRVSSSFVSNLTVQKKGTTGVFADTTTAVALTTATSTTAAKVTLGANATALYASVTVDTADLVAEKALVERDNRVAFVEQPAYANDVVLAGKVTNSSTGASFAGAVVTLSGPTSILFSNGAVDKRGGVTVVADANGEFAVTLYSTTAQTDSVITVTSMGVSSTTKVTFTGIGAGEGTKLDVTAPANVKPASTFQVKAKLSDVYGNGVEAAAGRIKVTYTGPGIVFGTLPDKTDKNGELQFSVLLGSNDTGNVVVTVSYDQNGDADYVDAKDLNTTKTITVGTGAAAGTGKVNVGSFNGKLVVYAAGLSGKTISWKVGGRWGKAVAASNYAVFNRPTPVAGATVTVDIYVDGVKTLTKSVVTR